MHNSVCLFFFSEYGFHARLMHLVQLSSGGCLLIGHVRSESSSGPIYGSYRVLERGFQA